jgi:hypothetical protein
MKTIFILTLLVLSGLMVGCQQRETASKQEPLSEAELLLCLERLEDPNLEVDSIDAFSMGGFVRSTAEVAPFSGEPITVIYLAVDESDPLFYNYFYELAASQKIDAIYDGQLYLKLGILKESPDGELSLDSSAVLSAVRAQDILDALSSGEWISLNMLMAPTLGLGASANSVHPCLID